METQTKKKKAWLMFRFRCSVSDSQNSGWFLLIDISVHWWWQKVWVQGVSDFKGTQGRLCSWIWAARSKINWNDWCFRSFKAYFSVMNSSCDLRSWNCVWQQILEYCASLLRRKYFCRMYSRNMAGTWTMSVTFSVMDMNTVPLELDMSDLEHR